MDETEFFNKLGFEEDPFKFTNADDEDKLEQYFIPPPYFDSVWGNPKKPRPTFIFAPRGAGKSAQRRMIESKSNEYGKVLCITYSRFEFDGKKLDDINIIDHIHQILTVGTVGLLTYLNSNKDLIEKLNETEKKVLKTLIQEYLGNIHEFELKAAIDSLKSFSEKAKNFWNNYFGAINMLVTGLLQSLNLQGVNIVKFDADEKKLARSYKYMLEMFRDLCLKIGFESVYVLLDKVDESELTGNKAEDSFKMIQSMVRDLELLEMDKFGFKFFLWDQLGSHFREYSRPDRVEQFTLEWSNEELEQMLAQRLSAYSGGKITDLEQITTKFQEDITPLVILFAQKSPRDAIRICKQIIAEQREINPNSTRIDSKAIIEGIENFCKIRALEITDEMKIRELRKIGFVEFTSPYLATDVFKISKNGARSKVSGWENLGVVKKVGTKTVKTSDRPVNNYNISDIRVAKYVFEKMSVLEFIRDKYNKCPNCSEVLLRDWDIPQKRDCPKCGHEIKLLVNNKVQMKFKAEKRMGKSSYQTNLSDF